jgi:cobalt-zinc-cadmium efflux system membrane fusion protein
VVADTATVWLIANVPESEAPAFRLGQSVSVRVTAYPDKPFTGRITAVGQVSDANTHTITLRSEIPDPRHDLRPGMLASFVIQTGHRLSGLAIPENGVVREGDGTMSIWVTTDRRHFTRRTATIGLQQDGMDQIIDGLKPGELVVTDGAIFLSNMLSAPPDA